MSIRTLSVIAILAFPLVASATEYRIVERPRQECWNEQVPVQNAGQGYGGVVLGGLAGGILGNQVGGGNGRAVATAVGAVTGALVGDQIANSGGPGYRSVQRCRTVVDHVRVPMVEEPAPVYVQQPTPVYVQTAPVYVQAPQTVVEQPGYYAAPAQPVYYGDRWDHRWHRHHHHDDDD